MTRVLEALASTLTASPLHSLAIYLLGNVPGFPPVVQTIHLLSIAAVMGSIVLIDLKVLGLALPSQDTGELVRRLMPWTWGALPTLALSGLVFILARPASYFVNPVFRLKFTMLAPAVTLAFIFQIATRKEPDFWNASRGRRALATAIAMLSLILWIGVVLAGRWIAYADYLFPVE